jgi:hypothetical protein
MFILQEWSEAEFVAHLQQIEIRVAQNIIHLLDEENTIPFIARYRKELTSDMSAEKLRDIKASYEMAKYVVCLHNSAKLTYNAGINVTPNKDAARICEGNLQLGLFYIMMCNKLFNGFVLSVHFSC